MIRGISNRKKTVFLMLAAAFFPGGISAEAWVGRITHVKGQVFLVERNSGERIEGKINSRVHEGQEIRTGHHSEARVILEDSSRLTIEAFSVVNITSRSQSEYPVLSVRVLSGKIWMKVSSGHGESLTLKTPTLLAALKSGEFACVATMNDARLAFLRGDSMKVANRSPSLRKAYLMKEKQEIRVKENEEPTFPRFLDADITDNYLDNYEINKAQQIKRRVREPERVIDRIFKRAAGT